MSEDGVLLIPGFFGFAAFGRGASQIVYFDHVAHAIEGVNPDLRGWIDYSEPPPTGSLANRVQNLQDKILSVLSQGIGGDAARKPARLHLIGHSTGGLDARLLVNRRYRFANDRRSEILDRIGAVVTVSAPLHGSPIAERMNTAFRLSLPAMYLLSIAAKAREIAARAGWTLPSLAPILELVPFRQIPDGPTLRTLLSLDDTTVADIGRFLAHVSADGDLIDDLKPSNMRALNAEIAEGDEQEHPLHSFADVSPPPHLIPPIDLLHPVGSLIFHQLYAGAYAATASAAFRPNTFPEGRWLGGDRSLAHTGACPNDGIVPSASHTLTGQAAGVVEADHLDVIGHFDSDHFDGTTLFESHAGFDDARFRTLWQAVAQLLRTPS
jgi:triacylglycerol lipase